MIRFATLGAIDLRDNGAGELRAVLRQPKRLALLAYLAVATPRGFHRRDTLLGLLWPELDDEHARSALRQAVRFLRRHLGADAIVSRGEEDLGLGERLWCDAVAFEQAVGENQTEAALELYRGDLLAGFFVSEAAPEFDQWIETERARLRALAAKTAWVMADQEERRGSAPGATYWARRAMTISPQDESALRRLITLLDRLGDRPGAVRAYEDFARQLAQEVRADPTEETEALAEAVRHRAAVEPHGGKVSRASGLVASGLAERQQALTHSSGRVELGAPEALQAWFTWRKALVAGAVVIAALGLGTAVYMAMRLLGIGPAGTLVASGVLKAREPLLLASFENRTTDSTLGPSLAEALRVDLSQSPTVNLLDPQTVADALQRMRRPPGTPIDLGLARELARREGVKGVVTGEIDPVGKSYQLSASLIAATNGRVLAAVRETATDDRALIGAIDRLSWKLRERIGESLKKISPQEPLAQVTTGSLEALRRYTQARQADDAGDYERAATLYQEATTLDTGFAMAHRNLAVTLRRLGTSQDRVVAATTKAFALRDRLPDVERDLVSAYYYTIVDYDATKVVAAYRSLLMRDPDYTLALSNLSLQLYARRQFREAESLAVRATERDPAGSFYALAFYAQLEQGHFADAETTLARFARVAPHNPWVLFDEALLASARGAYPAAEQAARALRDEQRSSLTWTNRATYVLVAVDAMQGKLSRAEREDQDLMALNERRGRLQWYLQEALDIALFDLRLRNQPAEGLRRIDAALRRHPLATIPSLDRPYVPLCRYYAHAGRVDEATRLLAEYERAIPEGIRRANPERHAAEGDLLLARGRIADAIARYQVWYEEGGSNVGLFEIATAYERAHAPDSALTYYERFVITGAISRVFGDKLMPAPIYRRLGALYEARGDRAKAMEYYRQFVDLWKDADPELQPVVREVRVRLARLAGEH